MTKESAAVAIFDTHQQAEDAIKGLKHSGFEMCKLSIVGKAGRSDAKPIGFYATGDRVDFWGGSGALWGGLLESSLLWIPGIGPLVVGGPLVAIRLNALEGAVIVGGHSALGAALYSLGVLRDRIVRYETALKADKHLVIVHGDYAELEKARSIMDRQNATADAISAA